MSSQLSVGHSLEVLESLKRTMEDGTARAAKLNEDYRLRLAKERRLHDTALLEQERQLANALAQANATYQAAKAASEQKFEKRKTRIGRAYQSSKERALTRVDDQLGARKYELQRLMLQAERDRDHGLATTTRNFEDYTRNLAAEQQALAQLEGTAQRLFKGYGRFTREFFKAYEKAEPEPVGDENQLLAQLRDLLVKAGQDSAHVRKVFLLHLFKYLPLWLALAVSILGLVPVLQQLKSGSFTYVHAGGTAALAAVLVLLARFLATRQAAPAASSLSQTLARARRLHDCCQTKSTTHYQQEIERIRTEYQATAEASDRELKQASAKAGEMRVSHRMNADERTVGITAKHEQLHRIQLERRERAHQEELTQLRQSAEFRTKTLKADWEQKQARLTAEHAAAQKAIETEWKTRLEPLYAELQSAQATAEKLFPAWDSPTLTNWKPPTTFARAARFAQLKVELEVATGVSAASEPGGTNVRQSSTRENSTTTPGGKLPSAPGGGTSAARLVLPGPSRFKLPLCLAYPEQGSLLIETAETGHDQAIAALNQVVLRLLSVAPPGRLNFTVLDPVGLGQNFAGVMHLADYEEQLINNRIWTQSGQIEQKLADLNEHMEKVIQMYLRNEYQTIAEYNEQAGVIAEKYHFLIVADFPSNFTDTAAKRLLSIAASGARCGVYTLIHWDRRQPLPQDFIPEELRKSSVSLSCRGSEFTLTGRGLPGTALLLEASPSPEQATEFIHQVGRSSRDSSRVEVPFDHVAPPAGEIWSEDTTHELRVPIGRTGATKLQYLAIGKGTCQHGLIAGKTGSGKSTLFHVIITNLAMWCSPEQVEFYLIDFKKGVEFKCYASQRLPHARVVAIESDREFALSVLQRIDDELRRRGDLFRKLGVQDIAGYKRAGGTEPIPRSLLMVDEFQEFFVEDDKIAQTASLLLDRIVRQGRAFGIHVLLGSQTLGGAYTVARTTLGQMVIRIALQCNEADAYLIMDDNNPAPRLLSRPGEGLYNDKAGALEGNSPFQTVWLPEQVRDAALTKVRERADQTGKDYPGPIVFEGNAPADVRENALLRNVLTAATLKPATAGRMWFGAPNSIKGPTEAVFQRQSGSNLLMVGQREEATLAMLTTGLLALAAQYPLGGARFIFCDATPPGTPERDFIEKIVRAIPHPLTLAKPGELPAMMEELNGEMKQRAEAADPDALPPVFLFVHDLQKFSRLRHEDDFGFSGGEADSAPKPAVVFNEMICEGTRLGFHVIATCDTYNNVSRFLSRKALSEFEMRILFQMSVNDSASLIDSPKAGTLGLHRALLFNAQEGYLETFRPYSLPTAEWVEQAAEHLKRLLGR